MAPKLQQKSGAEKKRRRVWPRVNPRKKSVSLYARDYISNMMKLDWVSRHLYFKMLSRIAPSLCKEIALHLTSDDLLTGTANASWPLVEVIPLRNKNKRGPRKKKPQQ